MQLLLFCRSAASGGGGGATRARAIRSAALTAGVFALLVFGGLPHAPKAALDRASDEGRLTITPAVALAEVRALFTNDGDIARYQAYAQAVLGRPYSSHYVRTADGWAAAFAAHADPNPDDAPVITPAHPLVPYRDFLVEYPPAFFLLVLPPAWIASTLDGYARAFKIEMAMCLALAFCFSCALGARAASDGAAATTLVSFAWAVLALGVVTTHRFDAFVALTVVASLAEAAHGRAARAAVWLALGVAAKGVPVVLAPLIGLHLYKIHGKQAAFRFFLIATLTVGALLGLAFGLCGPHLVDATAYHRARPLQIESTLGAALALVMGARVRSVFTFGSMNLEGAWVPLAGGLANLVSAGVMLAVLARAWRRSRGPRTHHDSCADLINQSTLLLVAYMALGKVFSPQYLVWVLPLGLIAGARSGARSRVRSRRVFVALLAASQLIYPIAYGAVHSLAPWALALVLARDLALVAWAFTVARPDDARPDHQDRTDRDHPDRPARALLLS